MKAVIELLGLDFYGYHGFYEEERKIGNRYTIDIKVMTNLSLQTSISLDNTINYETIATIAKEANAIPTPLLEDIALSIAKKILLKFNIASEVSISVSKHNPPIGIICERSKVSITLSQAELSN
jgi:dihydroneopterin aldolase